MARVYSPDPTFTGLCAGLSFEGGVARCDDLFLLGRLSAQGFGVSIEAEEEKVNEIHQDTQTILAEPLEKYTEAQLLACAHTLGLELHGISSKAELIALIRERG